MKKILLLLIIPAILLTMLTLSCKKEKPEEPTKPYSELIVGRWMTEDEGYFEEYLSDGNAKYWVPAEDIPEEDAKPFTWSIDEHNRMTQIHPMEIGPAVPQYCNILILNETTFKYNNEGWRATYNLIRVN